MRVFGSGHEFLLGPKCTSERHLWALNSSAAKAHRDRAELAVADWFCQRDFKEVPADDAKAPTVHMVLAARLEPKRFVRLLQLPDVPPGDE